MPKPPKNHQVPMPPRPTVEAFKEIVERHCTNAGVKRVADLTALQVEQLIDELALHFPQQPTEIW